MKVILHPYAARLFNGNPNPKNFPHFGTVVALLNNNGYEVVQIGVKGDERIEGVGQFVVGWPLRKLRSLVEDAATFIAVDSFLPHFVHVECGRKRGVVIWSQSNPAIWGHPENINLLRDRKYLREFQYQSWQERPFDFDAFVVPSEVVIAVMKIAPPSFAIKPQAKPAYAGIY